MLIIDKRNVRNILTIILCCVTIYFYIYTPNIRFIPFSVDKILLVLLLGVTCLYRRRLFLKVLSQKNVLTVLALYVCLFVYTFALDLIILDGLSLSFHVLQYSVQYILFSICLYLYMETTFGEDTLDALFKCLLIIAFIHSMIGLWMLLNPSVKSLVYGVMSETGELYKGLMLRGNGFSSGLMLSAPLVNTILISALLISRNSISTLPKVLLFFVVVIAAVTNARIALMPILLIVPYLCIKALSLKRFFSTLRISISVLFLGLVLWSFLPNNLFNEEQVNAGKIIYEWLIGGYANIFGIEIDGNKEKIGGLLLGHLYLNYDFLPLLFGTGENAFKSEIHSDIGVINLIRFGGLVYFAGVHLVTYYIFYYSYIRAGSDLYKKIIILTGMTYFITSLKGIVFTEQILGRFMILICVFVILHSLRNRLYPNSLKPNFRPI
jgi:hypothetical protein